MDVRASSPGLAPAPQLEHFTEPIRSHHMLTAGGQSIAYHMHDVYECHLFLGGDADFYVEDRKFHLVRGNLIVLNSFQLHRYVASGDEPYERVATHFQPELVRGVCTKETDLLACFSRDLGKEGNILCLKGRALDAYLSLTDQLHTALASSDYGGDVLAFTYLVQMLVLVNHAFSASTYEGRSTMPELSHGVMQYINQNLTRALTLDEIAGHFFLNKSYLSRRFKEETHCSLQNYIILKRIALAKSLLCNGRSVSEACTLSGFNDYANFIRCFKKHTQLSPGRYKAAMSKK